MVQEGSNFVITCIISCYTSHDAARDALVERLVGTRELPCYVWYHLRRVPSADVLPQPRWFPSVSLHLSFRQGALVVFARRCDFLVRVKGIGILEHINHVGHLRSVPLADVSVEGFRIHKHSFHGFYLRRFPSADVLVEGFGTTKHESHFRHLGRFPSADVLVDEGFNIIEHTGHVRRHLRLFPRRETDHG